MHRNPIPFTFSVVLFLGFALSGCDRSTPMQTGSYPVDFGEPALETNIHYITRANQGTVLIVWADTGSHSGYGKGRPDNYVEGGELLYAAGKPIKWESRFVIDEHDKLSSGKMTIADKQYRVDDGAVFLVKRKNDTAVVKQLKLDMSKIAIEAESIRRLARRPEIVAFFAKRDGKAK